MVNPSAAILDLPLTSEDLERAVELLKTKPAIYAAKLPKDNFAAVPLHFRPKTNLFVGCVLTSFKVAVSVSLIFEHEGDTEMFTPGGLEVPKGVLREDGLPADPALIRLHFGLASAKIFVQGTYVTLVRVGDQCDLNMAIEPKKTWRIPTELTKISRFMLA